MSFKDAVIYFGLALILSLDYVKAVEEKFVLTSVNCAIERHGGSSIIISGKEHSQKKDGLNIVVYDPTKLKVISSSFFSHTKSRRYLSFLRGIKLGSIVLVTSQLLCSKKSSTNLKIQKAVLLGLNRLGFDTRSFAPLDIRSAVFIFCKGKCIKNATFSMNLPYKVIHDFTQDPVMISFTLFKADELIEKKDNKIENSRSNEIILSIIISCCSVFIFASLVIVVTICYRRHKQRTKSLYHEKTCSHGDCINDCTCEIVYCSTEIFNQKLQHSTSARLFSQQKNNEIDRKGAKTSFATYVSIENKDHGNLYKVPSGVSKFDPPKHPPTHWSTSSSMCKAPCSTIADSDDVPHEYANPDNKVKEENQYVVELEDDEETSMSSFLDETLNNFAAYTSLEPYLSEEYVMPQNEHSNN